ncbi:MAG: bifunctional diaminohydroxyphosphoribosylaminopyrimidine [Frankiales bacterium]|nr:bifunctional diaminohydroxyphosphoribosylaminopyrimidine [Frankiales bacterium]
MAEQDEPIAAPGRGEEPTAAELAAMERAAALAWDSAGRTSPNPPVGAVILDVDGHRVGEGATQPAGLEHAEVMALRQAGRAALGGTAVVTLEPCNHQGRTGPCSEALIEAGVARVVFAVPDPNPRAAGGAQRLSEAGVSVLGSVGQAEVARAAIGPWLFAVSQSRPFVTWKFAGTLDGRSSAPDGTSKWITNAVSRADVHALRDRVDAIVVGSGTVLVDDPQLTVRGVRGAADGELVARQPLRVVLDRRHRVPADAQIFDDAAETIRLDTAVPRFALKALYDRGVRHVLLEGGATLAGAFLEARLIDEVVGYLAPTLLGAGSAVLRGAGITTMSEAVTLDVSEVARMGDDVKIVGRPRWASGQEE